MHKQHHVNVRVKRKIFLITKIITPEMELVKDKNRRLITQVIAATTFPKPESTSPTRNFLASSRKSDHLRLMARWRRGKKLKHGCLG